MTVLANAEPEKRLFISLITRDIPLVAAFLDLIDNSINAVVAPFAERLKTAFDYASLLGSDEPIQKVEINLFVSPDVVTVRDSATGISAKTAVEHVFKFGRSFDEEQPTDRLSVYGIGLKRAIFKLGNKIDIRSDHADGGFDLDLDVSVWAQDRTQPWTFAIAERPPVDANATGTTIEVRELYEDARRRIADGVFEGQLREAISRTYAYYLDRFVNISVNDVSVEGINIEIGENREYDEFQAAGVSCAIMAGIAVPVGGTFRARSSGWFVFCNGRAVLSAEKSELTGWGSVALPTYQPKHRPFLGMVFFVSENAERLPWTTTKSGINEDSAIWQEAKRYMSVIGRRVVSFLDSRYTDEGTEIASADIQEAAGARLSVVTAAVSTKRSFEPPKRPRPVSVRVQYDAKVADIRKVEEYLRQPGLGAAGVGRHTFHYFLKNEVGEE